MIPNDGEVAFIHEKYINELLKGICLSATRDELVRLIRRMKEDDNIEAVLLAGTELPLILTEDSAGGVPLLDTTKIHVEAAVERLFS